MSLPNGKDSALDRNQQEDDAVRGEPSNAITCTNNINIINANNVAIGDCNTLIFQPLVRQSGERMNTLGISEGFQTTMEPGDRESVDGETQISKRPVVTNNFIVRDSYIVAIGDNNVIYVQNSDEMFTSDLQTVSLKEASNFDQHRRTDQRPLRSELSQLPGLDLRVRTVFKRMSEIVDQLYPLRDCGKWQEIGDALNRLHQKYDSYPEIKCFLLVEESVTLTYKKCLKEAREKAEESLDNVYNEANKMDGALWNVLRVLANISLASIYRRQPKKKLGKAFQCLQNAMESGEQLKRINITIPNFVLALLDYEHARIHKEFPAVKCCNGEPRKFLELCIDRCRALSANDQLYTAKQFFALISLARLSLPSATRQSQPGQCHMITAEKQCCTRQAEKHLEEYERSHNCAEGSPVAAEVNYLMTRSEICFENKDYKDAKDYVCQALENANKYGLELEIVPAQNHLDHISRCCPSTSAQDKFQRVKDLSSSYDSSTTDSDQKYSVKALQRAT